jgi:putative spermidine/putrescine transport system ATP-binding protein
VTPLNPALSPQAGRAGASPYLVLEGLNKKFGDLHVTRDVSLSVEKSEILALLGPSGSGKTTVLRLVAGFETPDSGRILVEDEDVTRSSPEKRRFGIVFQHYALFPHMTVGENVGFGLESRGVGREESAARVAEALASVDLAGFERRRVTEISGGQQQRVALARALAPRPRVLLLDEPLSNLDPSLRGRTRRELKRVIRSVGITTLFVTHEQEEAFELGDRVALMNAGRLEQVGPAQELYDAPASRFAAAFIGRSSVVPATWDRAAGRARLSGGTVWPAVAGEEIPDGAPVDLVVRPEGLAFASARDGAAATGRVLESRFAGRETFFAVLLDGDIEVEVLAAPDAARPDWKVFVAPLAGGPPPRAYPADRPRSGER